MALAVVGLSAALASPAGVAMSLAPVVALVLRALRPPPPPLSDTPATTAALLQRGAIQILIGWLAIALPVAAAFALGVGRDTTMTLLKSGLFALAVHLAAWALVVSIRFGLGVADLLDRHRMASPAALVFTLVTAASLMMSGGGQAPALRELPISALALIALAIFGEVFLAANAIAAAVPPLRALELLERPRVFVPSLAVLVAVAAFFYNQQLVNALSFHVSRKHLLETVDQAEGGTRDPKKLFQHGIGGRSAVNFYTKDISAESARRGGSDVYGAPATRSRLLDAWHRELLKEVDALRVLRIECHAMGQRAQAHGDVGRLKSA